MPYHDQGWYMGNGSGVLMFIGMILFWVLIVAGIVFILRHFNQANHSHGPLTAAGDPPAEILKTRFAKGEIDEEEFTKRLKVLQGDK
jgi:putative membrane protein